jgi:hypothetical protein
MVRGECIALRDMRRLLVVWHGFDPAIATACAAARQAEPGCPGSRCALYEQLTVQHCRLFFWLPGLVEVSCLSRVREIIQDRLCLYCAWQLLMAWLLASVPPSRVSGWLEDIASVFVIYS